MKDVRVFYCVRDDPSIGHKAKEQHVSLPKYYSPNTAEPQLQTFWQQAGTYHFSPGAEAPVYSIDIDPPTVSGNLHLGHVYSYSHTDFMARFWRMNGFNVYYPMGYDDNGLPTERLVEKRLGITAIKVGRRAFSEKCLEISVEEEKHYEVLWQRLGLSIDWRYSYRTIDKLPRRTSQLSFLDLYRKGLAYRREAPTIWCPECRTAIAQAELNDLKRESELVTLVFSLEDGSPLPIATTRAELLPACVAVFVHPDDQRFQHLIGRSVKEPLSGREVPLLADPEADPEKGTGAVMCCTFGDTIDVEWWYKHNLPLKAVTGRDGRLTQEAGEFASLTTGEGRRRITETLEARDLVLERQPIIQSVRVHERCDTPVEYIVTQQWFVRVLDFKKELLDAGEQITWHPAHMKARYREWVENLHWDWCISRQRYFGVTFPLWYCEACGEILLASEEQLPVDPTEQQPPKPCACGSTSFMPEQDVMDTWATSSLSPQISGRWLIDKQFYEQVFPFSLRPQGHEIIRTWTFYTIVKSYHHFGSLPWKEIASTGYGKDSTISEEKIQTGAKLVTKLWNVARFSQRFLENYQPPAQHPALSPIDRWILTRTQRLIRRVTELFRNYDYAAAKSETESFFWRDLADNYLEMSKERLYAGEDERRGGARYTLYHVLLSVIKIFAPFLPYITEEMFQALFTTGEIKGSIHSMRWPTANETLIDEAAESAGETIVEVATAVRRYKSESNLSLGTELQRLQLVTSDPSLTALLQEALPDITSVTRARRVEASEHLEAGLEVVKAEGKITVALAR